MNDDARALEGDLLIVGQMQATAGDNDNDEWEGASKAHSAPRTFVDASVRYDNDILAGLVWAGRC